MILSAIVALSENRVIGDKNRLPWHLPADLRHFKQVTLGHPIIMGRKTHLSIGRPLPGRRNIVISRDKHFKAPGCEVFHSVESVFNALNNEPEAFVIGGAEIYQLFMPAITRLYVTVIHQSFSGDAFFPEIDYSVWQETAREDFDADSENQYRYSFITFHKKR